MLRLLTRREHQLWYVPSWLFAREGVGYARNIRSRELSGCPPAPLPAPPGWRHRDGAVNRWSRRYGERASCRRVRHGNKNTGEASVRMSRWNEGFVTAADATGIVAASVTGNSMVHVACAGDTLPWRRIWQMVFVIAANSSTAVSAA